MPDTLLKRAVRDKLHGWGVGHGYRVTPKVGAEISVLKLVGSDLGDVPTAWRRGNAGSSQDAL